MAISGIFKSVRPERPSVVRKKFLRVSKEAEAAVKSLHRLRITLDNSSPSLSDWLENLDLLERISLTIVRQDTPPFYALSSVGRKARFSAEALRRMDRGGRSANVSI